MKLRALGKTGLSVSPLSFGGSPLGGVFGDVSIDECIRTVQKAIDLGINLFDTSPYYALKRAETVMGLALEGGWREKIFLSTKGGRIAKTDFNFTPKHLYQSLDESLVRLKTDYVDIFIAHDIEFEKDSKFIFSDTVSALLELKKRGKCRLIGVSGYPLDLLVETAETCPLDLVLSYCHYTLLDTTLMNKLLPLTEKRGLGLINASALSMGLLTQQGPPDWHPAPPEVIDAVTRARAFCAGLGADLAKLALQFTLAEPRIATTLVGMSTVEEVERNMATLEAPIDESILSHVQAILEPVKDWGWPSGHWPAPSPTPSNASQGTG